MNGDSARAFQADFEALLEAASRVADYARSSAHLVFPLVDHLTRHEGVLDAVESVLGQEIAVEVDEAEAVPVVLAPGELSLHHGRMFHASGPNRSDSWRIGLAMQYIKPSMRQAVASRDFAQLVRGEDRYGHFEPLPRPKNNLEPEGLAAHARVSAAQNEALYDGAAQGPK